MYRLMLVFTLIVGFCVTVSSQRVLTELDLTVSGIRSGSSYRQVRKIGRPVRVRIIGYDECASKYRRVLYFNGLEVGLLGSKDGNRSTVISLTVTSSKWSIAPGIRIGATKESLIRKFGPPVSESETRLDYVTKENLGLVTFQLRNGKLIRVEMMETLC